MPLPVGQVQAVIDCYNRQLRSRRIAVNGEDPRIKADIVQISSQGKRRELLDKIGNDAVRAYKKTAVDALKTDDRVR